VQCRGPASHQINAGQQQRSGGPTHITRAPGDGSVRTSKGLRRGPGINRRPGQPWIYRSGPRIPGLTYALLSAPALFLGFFHGLLSATDWNPEAVRDACSRTWTGTRATRVPPLVLMLVKNSTRLLRRQRVRPVREARDGPDLRPLRRRPVPREGVRGGGPAGVRTAATMLIFGVDSGQIRGLRSRWRDRV
jgi:hypothetical protein